MSAVLFKYLSDRSISVNDHGGFIASIEGMRALAVLVVLLFHLDVPWFKGGFLGVDLFFVISGFIITRNIQFDLHAGKFTLREFYLRRFRRLFPALLVTVMATLLVSLAVLTPLEMEKTARSAIFALISLANFNFWLEAGYFDAAAHTKPLLHTWSLSVEEQFYLFWPALLVFLATNGRRVVLVCGLLMASLAVSVLWRNAFADAVFYLLPFRVHQLMAGALLALLSLRLRGGWGELVALLAVGGFLFSCIISGERFTPTLGAVVVTATGFTLLLVREVRVVHHLFANGLMQWLGKRSYAIYLVHWPIIVLYQIGAGAAPGALGKAALFIFSLVAAGALHELVEKPFRKRGEDVTRAQRAALPISFVGLLLALGAALAIVRMDGMANRIDPRLQQLVESVDAENQQRRQLIRFGQCNLHQMHRFEQYDGAACATPDPSRPNVLIIGDSFGADVYMMLSQSYPEIHFLQATAGACTGLSDDRFVTGQYPACLALNDYRFSKIVKQDLDLIILVSNWSAEKIEPLRKTVMQLQGLGQRVLVFGPRIVFHNPLPRLIANANRLENVNASAQEYVTIKTQLMQQLRAGLPGVDVYDLGPNQCAPKCDLIEGQRLLYFDNTHFSALGAKRFGERMRDSFNLLDYLDVDSTGSIQSSRSQ